MWWRNFAGNFAGQCVEQFMDSGPGGMHNDITDERKVIHTDERKVIHDNSALSVQRSKLGMCAIGHASFVTPSPPNAIAQAQAGAPRTGRST